MSVIYPLKQRRVYTDINHTISNIRNYWRKCLSLKKKKSRRGCIIRMKMIILLKLKPKTKTASTLKYDCKECHEEFRNKIALTTHSYSHNRKYLENTEDSFKLQPEHERIIYY